MYLLFLKNKLRLFKLSPEGNASFLGILQHPDGTVLKQLQPPPRGPRELEFYKKVRLRVMGWMCVCRNTHPSAVLGKVQPRCLNGYSLPALSRCLCAVYDVLLPECLSVPVPDLLHSHYLGVFAHGTAGFSQLLRFH